MKAKAKAKYEWTRRQLADKLAGFVNELDELREDSVDGTITRSDLEQRIQDISEGLDELSGEVTELK